MKRIAIIVEDKRRPEILKLIVAKIAWFGAEIVKVASAPNIQPQPFNARRIIDDAIPTLKAIRSHRCDVIILLLDHEREDECLITKRDLLEEEAYRRGYQKVRVVLKNRQLENWLIADPDAMHALKEFEISQAFRKRVAPNKADQVDDPVGLINTVRARNLKRLKKSRPNQQIAAQCDPLRVAQNSRSFRRFLRVAGHADYLQQSKLPA